MDTPHTYDDLEPEVPTTQAFEEAPEDEVVQVSTRERRLLLWFVVPVCLIALSLAALFFARSHHIAGPYVNAFLQREASRRGVDIYIKSMKPKGLFDVRLEEVRVRHQRGAYVLDTNMSHLDISPDLWQTIVQGRPVPKQISVEGAHILLERSSIPAARRAPPLQDISPSKKTSAPNLSVIELVGNDVTITLKAGSFATTKALDITRINASLPLQGAPLPTAMSAYGTLPDGVQFALSTKSREAGLPGNIIELVPQEPTHIDQWFEGQLPFSMVATGLKLFPGVSRIVSSWVAWISNCLTLVRAYA